MDSSVIYRIRLILQSADMELEKVQAQLTTKKKKLKKAPHVKLELIRGGKG